MRRLLALAVLSLAINPARAALYATNWTTGFANAGVVPDYNYSGWVDSRSVAAPEGTISTISVSLDLLGGWNGDLYAYLVNGSGFTVLLNNIGTGTYGNAGNGFDVTFSDSGVAGLGNYMANGSNPITGTWQPDGASFGSFVGLNPNSTWSLFIADTSGGGVNTVQSWGLQMDIVAVPEVESWIAAAFAGAFGAFWLNRQIWRGVRSPAMGSPSEK